MKKAFKTIIVIFVSILFLCTLSSCVKEDPYVVSAELVQGPTEILVNEFKYENYVIEYTYNDGTVIQKTLDDTMISFDDYLKTFHDGTQEITVNFKDFEYKFNITVARFSFDNVSLPDLSFDYDGKYHSLELKGGYPVETTVFYPNGNSFCNAGTYTVTAMLVCDQYLTKTITGKITINKVDFDISKIKFEDASFDYDGTEKEIKITGEGSEQLSVTYTIGKLETNKMTDSGEYEVVAHFDTGVNYNPIKDMKAKLTINKGTYNMEQYKFFDKTVVYNGETFTMNITNEKNLPKGVQVYYDGLDVVDAGTYEITAYFIGDSINYNPIEPLTAKLTIKKATITLSGVYLDSASFVYDKTAHSIYYTGTLPSGVSFAGYEGNAQTDVGVYTVKANFNYKDQKNYNTIAPLQATLEITQADLTGVVFDDESFVYDGYGHTISVKNLPSGVSVSYSTNGETEPGDYRVTATFIYNDEMAKNYKQLDPMTALLSIEKKNLSSGFEDMQFAYDGNNHMLEAYIAEEEEDWISVRYFTYDSTNQEITFTGKTDPGSYLVFAKYVVAPEYQEYYEKYYNQVDRESAILTITKMTYTPIFTNCKLAYDGTEKEILIDSLEASTHPHLSFTVQYTNNKNTDIGYYTGTANFQLSEESKKYYYAIPETKFVYAIRGANKVTYLPTMVGTQVTYDGLPHSIAVNKLPDGISVSYKGNGMIVPGKHSVRAVFTFDNDIAEYYYEFPNTFKTDVNGNPYMTASIEIFKKEYVISYNVGPFTYDGTNQSISVSGSVPWLTVEFEYLEEERIKPGTYTVICKPQIKEGTEQYDIYTVNNSELVFTINRATVKYSYDGLTVKYDGNKHYITVLGLPENSFEVKTSGDGKIDVGTYPVTITFENKSDCYNDIKDQKINLIIEYNYIDGDALLAFSNSTQTRYVSQFETFKQFLKSVVDMEGINVTWIADYYQNADTMYPMTNTTMHGSSTSADDFAFLETTTGTEFCLVDYLITLKDGFIYSNENIPTSIHSTVAFNVSEAIKVDIIDFASNFKDGVSLQQGTSILTYFNKHLDFTAIDVSYTLDYYNNGIIYDKSFTNCHYSGDSNNDFVFKNSTWNKSYCLVTVTLKSKSGYCLFDGKYGYSEYKSSVKVSINPTQNIDVNIFKSEIEDGIIVADQYDKFIDTLSKYIDTTNSHPTWKIYDGDTLVSENTDYLFISSNDLRCDIIFNVDDKYIFNDTVNPFSFNASFTIKINEKTIIDFSSFESYMQGFKYDDFDLYSDFFGENVSISHFPKNTTFKWEFTDIDGTVSTGNTGSGISFKKFVKKQANEVTIELTFYPNDGNVILTDTFESLESKTFTFKYQIQYREIVSLSKVIEFVNNTSNATIQQYTKVNDLFSGYLDYYSSIPGISIKYSIGTIKRTYMMGGGSNSYYDEVWDTYPVSIDTVSYLTDVYTTMAKNTFIELYLSLPQDSYYVFDTNSTKYVNYKVYFQTKRSELIKNTFASMKDQTISIKHFQTLNDTLLPFNHMTLDKWEVYKYANDELSLVDTGSMYYDHQFLSPTKNEEYFQATLTYKLQNGYFYYDGKDYYSLYTFSYKINVEELDYYYSADDLKEFESSTLQLEQFSGVNSKIEALLVYTQGLNYEWELIHSTNSYYNITGTKTKDSIVSNTYTNPTIKIVFSPQSNACIIDSYYDCLFTLEITLNVSITYWTKASEAIFKSFWTDSSQTMLTGSNVQYYRNNFTTKPASINSISTKYVHYIYDNDGSAEDNYISEQEYLSYIGTVYVTFELTASDKCYFGINSNGTPITKTTIEKSKEVRICLIDVCTLAKYTALGGFTCTDDYFIPFDYYYNTDCYSYTFGLYSKSKSGQEYTYPQENIMNIYLERPLVIDVTYNVWGNIYAKSGYALYNSDGYYVGFLNFSFSYIVYYDS